MKKSILSRLGFMTHEEKVELESQMQIALQATTKELIDAIHLAKQESIQELGKATQIAQHEIIAQINSVQAKQQEQRKMLEEVFKSQEFIQTELNDLKLKISTLETSVTTLRHDIEVNEKKDVDRQEKAHSMLQQLMEKIDGQEKGISKLGDDIIRAKAELQKDLSVNEELLRLSVTNQLMDSVDG